MLFFGVQYVFSYILSCLHEVLCCIVSLHDQSRYFNVVN